MGAHYTIIYCSVKHHLADYPVGGTLLDKRGGQLPRPRYVTFAHERVCDFLYTERKQCPLKSTAPLARPPSCFFSNRGLTCDRSQNLHLVAPTMYPPRQHQQLPSPSKTAPPYHSQKRMRMRRPSPQIQRRFRGLVRGRVWCASRIATTCLALPGCTVSPRRRPLPMLERSTVRSPLVSAALRRTSR